LDAAVGAASLESSLAVQITPYVTPPNIYGVRPVIQCTEEEVAANNSVGGSNGGIDEIGRNSSASKKINAGGGSNNKKRKRAKALHPDEPVPPKRPMSSYFQFMSAVRAQVKEEWPDKNETEIAKIISEKWKILPAEGKVIYEDMYRNSKKEYEGVMDKYKRNMDAFLKANPEYAASRMAEEQEEGNCPPSSKKSKQDSKPRNLFNKVVKLSDEGKLNSGSNYEYYYVLTYIPDLFWCHLAPMVQRGNFGLDKPKSEGRPIWMLVDENLGEEVDVSARFCEVVRARAMRNNPDADKEQWDIPDSGPATLTKQQCEAAINARKRKKNCLNGESLPLSLQHQITVENIPDVLFVALSTYTETTVKENTAADSTSVICMQNNDCDVEDSSRCKENKKQLPSISFSDSGDRSNADGSNDGKHSIDPELTSTVWLGEEDAVADEVLDTTCGSNCKFKTDPGKTANTKQRSDMAVPNTINLLALAKKAVARRMGWVK